MKISVSVTSTVPPPGSLSSMRRLVGSQRTVSSAWPGSAETLTRNVPAATLPAASVAVQLTVVSPMANSEPLAGAQTVCGFGSSASTAPAS